MLRNEAAYDLLSRATGVVAPIILNGLEEEVRFGFGKYALWEIGCREGKIDNRQYCGKLQRLRQNASKPLIRRVLE